MKLFLFSSFLLFFSSIAFSQVGIGTTNPLGALDVTSTTDGLLIPRVSLFNTALATPLTAPTTSEIVYNTSTVGNVTPGFYYWNGSWVRFATGAVTGWLTTGNTGIVDGTNYIGTAAATNIDVAFRRNNLAAGKISATSTSFGLNALTSGPTTNGTAFGVNALAVNTGANNTALGTNALLVCDTPSDNTALGYQALKANTGSNGNTGNQNTAVGSGTLASLNGGLANTAVGYNALNASPSLTLYDTAVGAFALSATNDSASRDNVAVGYNAMKSSPGYISNSVAIGSNALLSAVNATKNTAIGYFAGSNITAGSYNVVIGSDAQTSSAGASREIVIGAAGAASTAYVNAPSWSYSSDRRLKSDIKDSPLGLDFIKTIRPVSYFRNDDVNKKTEYGFIAQELEIALANAGSTNNGILSHTANGMFAVRYNDFLPISIKAIQEQQLQIEALQKKNEELMKVNAAIIKRLEALERHKN